jgi:hypothetical protein
MCVGVAAAHRHAAHNHRGGANFTTIISNPRRSRLGERGTQECVRYFNDSACQYKAATFAGS